MKPAARSVAIATATVTAPAAAVAAAAAAITAPAAAATTAAATTTVAATAAAATTTTVAAATTATTTEAAAAAASGTLFTGTGDVHGQGTAAQILAVEHFHSAIGLVRSRELDERETAGLSGHAIEHQVDIGDHTGRRKVILEVTFLRLVGQVSHKQTGIVIHTTFGRSSTE